MKPPPAGDARPLSGPEPGDEDLGVFELAWKRLRTSRVGLVGAGFGGLSMATCAVGLVFSLPLLTAASSLAAVLAFGVLAIGMRRSGAAWRVVPTAPDDAIDPISIRWRNRPGFPGPKDARAHVLGDVLRIVGREPDLWDMMVVAGAVVGTVALLRTGWIWPVLAAQVLGLPRNRRVAVDLPWDSITDATIDGPTFEIRTDLAEPADRCVVEAKYSARERLTAALRQRVGERVHIARKPPRSIAPAAAPAADAADLAAAAERLRALRDGDA